MVYIRTHVYTHYVGYIYTVYTHSSIQWGVLLRNYSPTELAMCKNYTVYTYLYIYCVYAHTQWLLMLYGEVHSCIELTPIEDWWATTQLLIILTNRMFRLEGLCLLPTRWYSMSLMKMSCKQWTEDLWVEKSCYWVFSTVAHRCVSDFPNIASNNNVMSKAHYTQRSTFADLRIKYTTRLQLWVFLVA